MNKPAFTQLNWKRKKADFKESRMTKTGGSALEGSSRTVNILRGRDHSNGLRAYDVRKYPTETGNFYSLFDQ